MPAGRTTSDDWTLDELFALFDVEQLADDRFLAASLPPRVDPAGQARQLVEGSQILGQAMVAASRSESDRFVKSGHMVFARPASIAQPVELRLSSIASGRSFSSLSIRAVQRPDAGAERLCAEGVFLLDDDAPDFVRHDPEPPGALAPGAAGPDALDPFPLAFPIPVAGRHVRVPEGAAFVEAEALGPPRLAVWVRHERAPSDRAIRQALVADLCSSFTIATAMRPHPGVGQDQAHRSISTGVLSLTVHFHAPCDLQGWMLLDHDALHAGRGLCDGKGRIFDASGRLIASFEQEALLRPLPAGRAGGANVL